MITIKSYRTIIVADDVATANLDLVTDQLYFDGRSNLIARWLILKLVDLFIFGLVRSETFSDTKWGGTGWWKVNGSKKNNRVKKIPKQMKCLHTTIKRWHHTTINSITETKYNFSIFHSSKLHFYIKGRLKACYKGKKLVKKEN